MAGIGRSADMGKDSASIQEIEKDFNECVARIRKILGGQKDKNKLSDDDRNTLRREYSQAAQLARTLSVRCTDDDKVELYKDYFKKLSDRAASYGSVIRSKVPDTTLDDIKGQDAVKRLVNSFIFMAKNPSLLKHYHLEGGLGMLMYGAPGTGKTMFAEAIANAMNLPLFIVTPADIFKSYVGESEQAVKQIFQELDACPDGTILFVDECESIFSRRTSDTKDYKAAVTTELLQRINGFGVSGSNRIMIGATNRPDLIDPAYLRFKRFSHLVHVAPPDLDARRAIITSKIGNIKLDGFDAEEVVQMAQGFILHKSELGTVTEQYDSYYSAADLCGIIEEACRLALEQLQATKSTSPIPLTRDMFKQAFAKTPPSIPHSLYMQYENFRKLVNK